MEKKRSFLKSLKGKITMQMLTVSLVPLIVIGALVYYGMSTTEDKADDSVEETRTALEQQTVGAGKANQAWIVSIQMENWATERIREVMDWTKSPAAIDALENYSGSDGEEIGFLKELLGSGEFNAAYLVDMSGQVLAQYSKDDPRPDFSGRSTWQSALDSSMGIYVGEGTVINEGILSSYEVEVAAAIRQFGSAGNPLGVIVGVMNMSPMALGERYGAQVPGSRLAIWDARGQIMVDSEDSGRYLDQQPEWTAAEASIMEAFTGDHSIIEPSYVVNEDVVAGYARASNMSASMRVAGFEGLGWTVMVEEPGETAFAALASLETLKDDLTDSTRAMLITMGVVILAVFFAVSGVAYWLSQSITKPVKQLSDVAEKVSMGDLDVNVDVTSDDEIGDLAQSFGRMVTAVRFLSQDEE
jgi:HAMP domain-containing protein